MKKDITADINHTLPVQDCPEEVCPCNAQGTAYDSPDTAADEPAEEEIPESAADDLRQMSRQKRKSPSQRQMSRQKRKSPSQRRTI